ncbi:unnamed protein product, partial [Closterium sp. Naga37s-1]
MGLADKLPTVQLPDHPSPRHPPPSDHSPAASPSANPSPSSLRPGLATGRGVGIVPLPKFPSRLDRTPGDASGASRHINRTHSAPPQELSDVCVERPLEPPAVPSVRSPSSSSVLKPPAGAAFRARKDGGSARPQRTSSGGNAVMRMAKIVSAPHAGNGGKEKGRAGWVTVAKGWGREWGSGNWPARGRVLNATCMCSSALCLLSATAPTHQHLPRLPSPAPLFLVTLPPNRSASPCASCVVCCPSSPHLSLHALLTLLGAPSRPSRAPHPTRRRTTTPPRPLRTRPPPLPPPPSIPPPPTQLAAP